MLAVDSFIAFITEREAIRQRREAGQPWPWTDDRILRKYYFCNVERENDKQTKGITALFRTPHKDDPNLWFALLVARRAVNWTPTLADLGYPIPWNPEHFKSVIRHRQKAALKAYEAQAYKVMVSGQKGEQAELITSAVLSPAWEQRSKYGPRPNDTLSSFANRLAAAPFMGTFYSGQVVADLKYAQLRDAPDWHTFAMSGPGSRRGLDRLQGKPPRKYWPSEAAWYSEFRQLYDAVREPIRQATGLGLHAQDCQNALCEFDKYLRLQNGEGERSVRRYTPPPALNPQPPIAPTIVRVKETTMSDIENTTENITVGEQIARLQKRWREVAAADVHTPKWSPPTELEWSAWLQQVPYIVLLEDVLGRLEAYRGSVRTDASTYLSMIVNNDGPKFMATRGLSRPKFVDDEDEQVVFIPR